jgi:RNA polymerase sigma-70 factor, ECF subfamily
MFGRPTKEEDFETAAMPYLNDLFRTTYRVIGDRAEAEDLVQEAYLQAWKSFHSRRNKRQTGSGIHRTGGACQRPGTGQVRSRRRASLPIQATRIHSSDIEKSR